MDRRTAAIPSGFDLATSVSEEALLAHYRPCTGRVLVARAGAELSPLPKQEEVASS